MDSQMRLIRSTKVALFTAAFLVLCVGSSCTELPLVQELDQQDANEIMVILSRNGITARQESVPKQQETSWSIYVSKADEQRAREILVANYLPRKKELGLSGICKEAGMIPTPKTEKCREMLALKGEIINSLESIPGVVNADVVINIPDKEDFPDEDTPLKRPAASVVVQIGDSASGDNLVTESKVQQFVANAVQGMDMRDVAVIISRVGYLPVLPEAEDDTNVGENVAPPSGESDDASGTVPAEEETTEWISIGGMTIEAGSAAKLKAIVAFFLLFFILLAGGLIYVVFRLARLRQRAASVGLGGGGPPQIAEKAAMDRLVEQTGQQGKAH